MSKPFVYRDLRSGDISAQCDREICKPGFETAGACWCRDEAFFIFSSFFGLLGLRSFLDELLAANHPASLFVTYKVDKGCEKARAR